jgi:hypothetical protein
MYQAGYWFAFFSGKAINSKKGGIFEGMGKKNGRVLMLNRINTEAY